MRRLLTNLAVFLGTSIVCFIALEAGTRLYFLGSLDAPDFNNPAGYRIKHPVRGWTLAANKSSFIKTLDFRVWVETNSMGLRDVERKYEADDDVFRIVVLGDSFMEAYQVALQDSFPRQLEIGLRKLGKKIEVINLGVGGYGTAQELLYLKEEGLKYKPDLVLLAFLPSNDIRNNHETLEYWLWKKRVSKVMIRPYYVIDKATGALQYRPPRFTQFELEQSLLKQEKQATFNPKNYLRMLRALIKKHSYFATHVVHSWRLLKQRQEATPEFDPNVGYGWPIMAEFDTSFAGSHSNQEYVEAWQESWQVTTKLIKKISDTATQAGAKFMVMMVPDRIQVDPSYLQQVQTIMPSIKFDLKKIERELGLFAEKSDIKYLNLCGPFRDSYQQNKDKHLYHRYADLHWNSGGHELATRSAIEFMNTHNLLAKKN